MNRLVGRSQADEKGLYKRVTGFSPILVFSSTGGIDIMAVDAGLLNGEKQTSGFSGKYEGSMESTWSTGYDWE